MHDHGYFEREDNWNQTLTQSMLFNESDFRVDLERATQAQMLRNSNPPVETDSMRQDRHEKEEQLLKQEEIMQKRIDEEVRKRLE